MLRAISIHFNDYPVTAEPRKTAIPTHHDWDNNSFRGETAEK